MTNLYRFSKLWLVLNLQIFTCFGLPVWSTNETGLISPCTTKLIVVDDVKKSNDLTIPYSICKVERPTCFINTTNRLCYGKPIQEEEHIQEAQFVDKNGKVNSISHDNHHFNVSLKGEDFITQGIYNYPVSYYYETVCDDEGIPPPSCYGWINMSLIIVVTDVRLTVVSDEVLVLESEEAMTQKRFQVMEGAGIVDLECSLGLAKHLNMQLEFVFTPAENNATKNKTILCSSESNQMVDNWVVTPNMNNNTCHLKIVNISKADGGKYDCLMIVNNSHTSYNQDRSNAVILAVESLKHQDKHYYYYVIPLVIVVTVAIAILCSVILVAFRKKIREKHRPLVDRNLTGKSYGSTVQCHRALRTIDETIIDPGPDTPYHTDHEAEIETSLSEHGTDSKPTTPLPTIFNDTTSSSSRPATSGSSSGPGATFESSSGASPSLEQISMNSQDTHQSQEGSTISAGTEGRQYYEQHTDILHPDGRQTPENSKAPLNENYKCRYCGRIYHDDQRLFYARHMKECQQRCPCYNGEAGMNTTNRSTLDTNGAQSPGSLTVGSSEGTPSMFINNSSHSGSMNVGSRASTMSEIREGRGYYNDYTEVQVPEDGPTPEETEIPLDNHYSCPFCGKTYHENQRLYFKRHIDELRDRCPKYESLMAARGSSGSSSLEQST